MRILLSNDDGYFATGLEYLMAAVSPLAEVTVVAPERDCSGASNSLTLDRPLKLKTASNGFHYVNGTPTDCVHLAVTGFLKEMPDMIISGINRGENMGDDTLYSGTVAAATEGFLLGIPSIAVSLCAKENEQFETAVQVVRELVERHQRAPMPGWLLNVNVPNLPFDRIKGFQITHLGRRHKAAPVIPMESPRGGTVYWVGAAGQAADDSEGTDFYAVEQGCVSVTPLQVDLTQYRQLESVGKWFGN